MHSCHLTVGWFQGRAVENGKDMSKVVLHAGGSLELPKLIQNLHDAIYEKKIKRRN